MFQCISGVVERPIALLKEKSGASHGQKSRSTGQPKRDEATRSGTEKRSGGGARSIGPSFPTGGAIRHAEERKRHARKSGPSRVIATGSRVGRRLPRPDDTGPPREAMPPL